MGAATKPLIVALAGAASLLLSGLSLAQTVDPNEARKRLEADKTRLEATKKRSGEVQGEVAKIAAERARIDARLIETGKLIHQSEGQLTLIESRLSELESQRTTLRGTLEAQHGTISSLLAAMQRMGRNPPPVMITRREDALSMVRSAMLLASAFPELRTQAVALGNRLNDLMRVMASIRSEGDKLRAETTRLSDARTRLSSLQESKRQSLEERRAELATLGEITNDMTKRVADLSDLIAGLDKEVAEKTGLGTYEQTLAAKGQRPGSDDPPAAVLAPSEERLALLTPGRLKPAMAFNEAKGLSPLPAQGKRIRNFGEKTQYGTLSKGLIIETRPGGAVVSPCDGWIVYAGDFRSYGRLLIINAGGGYHILLAGLSQIDARVGQFVLTGEPVGMMGGAVQTPPAKTQESPLLYVEFRKDQRPIDPDPWWADASRKVQG